MEEEFSEAELIRYLEGDYTQEEELRVEAWLRANAERLRAMQDLKRIWEAADRSPKTRDVAQMWADLSEKMDASETLASEAASPREEGWQQEAEQELPERSPARRPPWRRARFPRVHHVVSVLLIVAVGALIALYGTETSGQREVTTATGERATIQLSDGTEVTLNAESELTIPSTFDSGERIVRLQGEAYFEVPPEKGRPFLVRMGHATTRVLGTKFGVVAYPDEPETRVVVAEGKVAVNPAQDEEIDALLLEENDLASIANGEPSITRRSVEASKYLAWTEGQLLFKDASFHEVAGKLRRWYGLDVRLAGATTSPDRLNATFHEDDPVSEVLAVIAKTLKLKYEREEDHVTFTPKSPQYEGAR